MMLHDWFYQVVADVCYDRDYLYLAYIRHFSALMDQIVDRGRFEQSGEYAFPGMKSNLEARLEWQLEHQLSWTGPNGLSLHCKLVDSSSGMEQESRTGRFDFSTGEMFPA
jgi:hypothetical protein